jgi:hypothetical protein
MNIITRKNISYTELLPEEKFRFRKALRQMQQLINEVQTGARTDIPEYSLNPNEIKALLKIRHEMLELNKSRKMKKA